MATITGAFSNDDQRPPVERLYRREVLAGDSADADAQRALAGFVAAASRAGDQAWLDRNLAPLPGVRASFRICVYSKRAPEPSVLTTPNAGAAVSNAIFALDHDDARLIDSIEVISDDGRGLQRCVLLASHLEGARILPPIAASFLGTPEAVDRAAAAWLAAAEPEATSRLAAHRHRQDPAPPVATVATVARVATVHDEIVAGRIDAIERTVDELAVGQRALAQEFDQLRRRILDTERDRIEYDDLRQQALLAQLQRMADRLEEGQHRLERQLRTAPPAPEVVGAVRALADRVDDLSVSVRRAAVRDVTAGSELLGSRARSGTHRPSSARRSERRTSPSTRLLEPTTGPLADPLVHSPAS